MTQSLGLAGDPLRLLRLEPACQYFLDQVAAQAALDLRGGALLGQLQREDGGAVLQRTNPSLSAHLLLVETDREEAQHLRPRTNWDHVERARGPPGLDSQLTPDRAGGRGDVDSLRHPVG